MIQHSGYWFPDDIGEKHDYFLRHKEDSLAALNYLGSDDRGTVVQAGGHVGLWPSVLSHWFKKVYTFEPDPENYQCLLQNTRHHIEDGSIVAYNSGVSSSVGWVNLVHSPVNTGGHYIGGSEDQEDALMTTTLTIDSLSFTDCTAIFLDIEGHELEALRGAEQTIEAYSPLLMLEVKDHSKKGGVTVEELEEYLHGRGYNKVGTRSHDSIYVRA